MADADPPPAPLLSPIESLLSRPAEQRLREYKYRFAQSAVFGLPVVALEVFGRALGGAEADRWVGVLQALLAGWVVYVGAAGMLFEGLLLIRRRVRGDLVVASLAWGLYLLSLVRVLGILLSRDTSWPTFFHWSVLLIAAWTALQWWRLAQRPRSSTLNPEP